MLVLLVIRRLCMPVPMINVRLLRGQAFTGAAVTDLLSMFTMVSRSFQLCCATG
ncbi:hypothetical protein IU469_08015 [Nocardia puris]|nr:hypothetical protein [Nocardia puris]